MYSMYNDITREEWFAMFVNAITETFDPHSNYMAPDIKEGSTVICLANSKVLALNYKRKLMV